MADRQASQSGDDFSSQDDHDDQEMQALQKAFDDMDFYASPCNQQWETELPEAITAMALSPKRKLLAVATVEPEIMLLDTATGEIKYTLAGHKGGTNGIVFVSGSVLASCGEDGSLRIWSIPKQACVTHIPITGLDADASRFASPRGGRCWRLPRESRWWGAS